MTMYQGIKINVFAGAHTMQTDMTIVQTKMTICTVFILYMRTMTNQSITNNRIDAQSYN